MIEPKSGLETGVWREGPEVWLLRVSTAVVLDLENSLDPNEPKVRVFHVSRCPPCERSRFKDKRVVRWLVLPP